jgi:PPOX class probable F420-dependent enzyme
VPALTPAQARALLDQARVARLATADASARPHIVPVVFAIEGDRVFIPIDHKPKRADSPEALRRVRNLRSNPRASMLVDRYDEDWHRLAWVRVDGRVELVSEGGLYREGVKHLSEKYPQYREHPLPPEGAGLVIVLAIGTLRGWSGSEGRPE